MNGLHRRLLRAFVQSGGDLSDERDLDRFAALVRSHVLLLTARIRRAVEMALDGGEDVTYDVIATRLAEREGHPVSVTSVRQRVSRGGRALEAAVRRALGERRDAAVPPPAAPLNGGTIARYPGNGMPAGGATGFTTH